jgi:hypothetical protein
MRLIERRGLPPLRSLVVKASMRIAPLTLNDHRPWAGLLAASFGRQTGDMQQLLTYFHTGYQLIAYGAWDRDRLAAQYCCLMTALHVPGVTAPMQAGMSVNMTTHSDYRGRGLIKQLATPAYEAVAACGGMMGVGFSNAEGVRVDKHSRGYGYHVVGRMRPTLAVCARTPCIEPLRLTDNWIGFPSEIQKDYNCVSFVATEDSVRHRFAQHPFRRYAFGVWEEGSQICGLVVFRRIRIGGLAGVGLLAAYGADLPSLIARWLAALAGEGIRVAHLITSPGSALSAALRQHAVMVTMPGSRSPHYLTLKPLSGDLPAVLNDFDNWDCTGGDIL